jgi:hypothetical protein
MATLGPVMDALIVARCLNTSAASMQRRANHLEPVEPFKSTKSELPVEVARPCVGLTNPLGEEAQRSGFKCRELGQTTFQASLRFAFSLGLNL